MNKPTPKPRIGHGEKYSRKREEAIASLLNNSSVKKAARQIGIGEKTLRRWLQNSDFNMEYEQERKRIFDTTIEALAEAGPKAVSQLQDIMWDIGKERVPAAKAILDAICKMKKLEAESQAAEPERKRSKKQGAPVAKQTPSPEEDATDTHARAEEQPPPNQVVAVVSGEKNGTTMQEGHESNFRKARPWTDDMLRERYPAAP
jgi:transposase-like protein